jgi:3D (Asp-Asp-Asp) domain-containing protein
LTRIETVGSEVFSPTLVGEWVSQPPADEIIGYGTNIVERTIDTPDGPLTYWRVVRMRVTAYTAADAGRSPDHPSYGITASGRRAGYGIVAIDPNVVPFRSQVYVPGYGVAFAGDTGGAVKGRWIDLGYDDGQIQTWNGYVDVYYLTPVPEPDRINYLIPSALP